MTNKPSINVSYEMEVPFFDVDTYRIVWHGNYPKYFEVAVKVTATLKEWEHKLIVDYVIHDIDTKELMTKGQTTQVAVLMPGLITQFQSPKELTDKVNKLIAENEA